MHPSELTKFFAELTEFDVELSEFSLPKQYSQNSILPFPILAVVKAEISLSGFWPGQGGYFEILKWNVLVLLILASRNGGKGCNLPGESSEAFFFRESFCESGGGVGFPGKRADLWRNLGNFRGSPGHFRGSPGSFRGTSGLVLGSTVRELPGKLSKNFRGSLGTFQKPGVLTPSQRLAKFVSNLSSSERCLYFSRSLQKTSENTL